MAKTTKTGKPVKPAPSAPRVSNGASKAAAVAQPAVAPAAPEGDAAQPSGQTPGMKIIGQYLKDLSFENPNAPQSLAPQQNQPDINISVNVNVKNLAPSDFEVELHLDAKANAGGKIIFAAELIYAGIFRMENYPPNLLHAAVLIECPRMLFPFARQIMADATRNGGFPPLMLDPIDFVSMYQRRLRAQQQQA